MRIVLISRVEGQTDIILGTPDSMVENAGSYNAALGRLFLGEDKDKQVVEITYSDGHKETYFLKEVP